MIVQLKREEQGGIDHHPPIEADDHFIWVNKSMVFDSVNVLFTQKSVDAVPGVC
jgi:hypothetical protein